MTSQNPETFSVEKSAMEFRPLACIEGPPIPSMMQSGIILLIWSISKAPCESPDISPATMKILFVIVQKYILSSYIKVRKRSKSRIFTIGQLDQIHRLYSLETHLRVLIMKLNLFISATLCLLLMAGCSKGPSSAEFLSLKAEMYLRSGETVSAQTYVHKALDADPNLIEAHLLQSKIYVVENKADKAIEQLEKAREIDAQDLDVLYSLGFMYTRKGSYDKALNAYNEAIAIYPDTALGYNNIAVTYHSKKDFKKAVENYKKALNINPTFVEAHYNLGNSYAMIGKMKEAIESYNKSVELDPKYTDAYIELSSVYEKLGNQSEAGNNVGLFYFWKEQYEKAAKAFEDVIKANPNYAVAYNNLAVTYDKLGNRELSMENLKKSASLGYSPAIDICKKNNILF